MTTEARKTLVGKVDSQVLAFTIGKDPVLDLALAEVDCIGSAAHVTMLAGLDTVTSALGCNTAYLAANPTQRQVLLDEPEAIPTAVEELLRWETPVTGVPRIMKQTVTLGGMELKEGELITLLLGASNVDDGEFGDAENVDLKRDRNRHLAFGGGAHRCLGSHLARMELCVAMEEWHRRIPSYQIRAGETPRYSPGIREVQYLPLVWPGR
jgi:cytochrome P450